MVDNPGASSALKGSNGEKADEAGYRSSKQADGCIVLGKNGRSAANVYTTRYTIDHSLQRKDLTQDIVKETFAPCCMEENRESLGRCLWTAVACESFLFSLHVLALSLGVSKEVLRFKDVNKELELIHSAIETTAACLQLSIRTVAVYVEYRSIEEHVSGLEDISSKTAVRGNALRRAVISYCVLGTLLVLASISCMIAFKEIDELGWTIMSNNFALVTGMLFGGLVKDRMDKVVALIREDQHKAVLFEAVLLLKEAQPALSSPTPGLYFYQVNKFIRSLSETDMFEHPGHIKMAPGSDFNKAVMTTSYRHMQDTSI